MGRQRAFSLAEQLGAYQTVLATIPKAPKTAPAPSLGKTLADLFLGLASMAPRVGPVFGLADLFFNFGTGLTTDPKGNQTINLTSTIGNLETQTANLFIGQAYTTGTLFEFIYEDWGKLSAPAAAPGQRRPSSQAPALSNPRIIELSHHRIFRERAEPLPL